MPKKWTLAAAFDYYGAAGANPRWSWSARTSDGNTVILTLWRDEFDYSTEPVSYSSFGNGTKVWSDRPGNRERLDNLKWARAHCGGLFRVVITVARDPKVQPRTIESCAPQPRMIMKITDLDEATGEFRAELVGDAGLTGR